MPSVKGGDDFSSYGISFAVLVGKTKGGAVMKLYRLTFLYFFLLWFTVLPLFNSLSHGGGVSGRHTRRIAGVTEGSRHSLTGTVTKVDAGKGTLSVKGRRGNLSFELDPEWAKQISTGERVRVYYVKSPDKKNVVTKIKKLNNGNESAAGARGLKGRKEGGH